jgi:hypothetical protein
MTSHEDKKRNISLIIGLSIPVAMVVFIAVAINGPRWFNTVEPAQFNFLYSTGPYNSYVIHTVNDGQLEVHRQALPEGASPVPQDETRFFVHDVTLNVSKEIQEDEAIALRLDGSIRSPDGFAIETGRRGGWFIFGYGRNHRNHYLVKERYSQELSLESSTGARNYYWNFKFLAWVVNDG